MFQKSTAKTLKPVIFRLFHDLKPELQELCHSIWNGVYTGGYTGVSGHIWFTMAGGQHHNTVFGCPPRINLHHWAVVDDVHAKATPTRLHLAIFRNYVETMSKLWEARGVWVGEHTWRIFFEAYPFWALVGLTNPKLASNRLLVPAGFQHVSTIPWVSSEAFRARGIQIHRYSRYGFHQMWLMDFGCFS